jgi:hypothetical protein
MLPHHSKNLAPGARWNSVISGALRQRRRAFGTVFFDHQKWICNWIGYNTKSFVGFLYGFPIEI